LQSDAVGRNCRKWCLMVNINPNTYEIVTDPTIEYPQSYITVINGVSYYFAFRFNALEGFLVLSIIRVWDKKAIFQGKLCDGSPIYIYGPNTHMLYFGLMPISTIPENVLIYLLTPGVV
jgi:hypothetical protein